MSVTKNRVHLKYLDGIRGLAALMVMLEHTHLAMKPDSAGAAFPVRLVQFIGLFDRQVLPVDIFIVLSGYCLMIPVARSAGGLLRGGWREYIQRRSWRILPPYYCALLLSLVVVACTTAIQGHFAQIRQMVDFRPDVILSHLFLIHNLRTDWICAINGPMWSIATEWQIYFLFPLILLPVWRRFGTIASVLTAFAIGLLPHWLFHGDFDIAYPWYVGLFGLGMAGAVLNFSGAEKVVAFRRRIAWGPLTAVIWATIVVGLCIKRGWYSDHLMEVDSAIGVATMCLLVYCTNLCHGNARAGSAPRVPLLDHPWIVRLGTFSYSIYLIHFPILYMVLALVVRIPVSEIVRSALFLSSLPVILAIAYGFHLLVERPFLSARDGNRAGASPDAR